MSRGPGYVQRAVRAALVSYRYRSTPDIIRDVYGLHAHGREIEAHAWSKTQYDAALRALRRLEELSQIRLTDRVNAAGEQCWTLAKLKPDQPSKSWRAEQARTQGPRLVSQ